MYKSQQSNTSRIQRTEQASLFGFSSRFFFNFFFSIQLHLKRSHLPQINFINEFLVRISYSNFPFPVSCFLFAICYLLFPVSCFLFPISYFLFPISCSNFLFRVFGSNFLFEFPISCFLFPVSYFLFPISCFLFPISYFLFPISYFLFEFPISSFWFEFPKLSGDDF